MLPVIRTLALGACGLAVGGSATYAKADQDPQPQVLPEASASHAQTTAYPEDPLLYDHGWPAGSIQQQLDKDTTQVPFGKGALFVPALGNALDEPQITVWQHGVQLGTSTTGARVVLPPGHYDVEIGSGQAAQRFWRSIEVTELHTSIVPVDWSGLTIHVVDAQLNSLRAPYDIFRMGDHEYLGVGFGTDERAGEPVATWLLTPDLYRIVRVGMSYLARTDFTTVRLRPGVHTHFLLVLDPDTWDFVGAGEARPEELFRPSAGWWASLMLGGDVSLNARRSVVGYPDGTGYAINGFWDSKLNFQIAKNPLLLRLQILEGQTKRPGLAWQKIQDRAQLDLLYIYRWLAWVGPYVRGTGSVNLFAGRQYFTSPQQLFLHDSATGSQTEIISDRMTLSSSLASFNLRQGLGLNTRLLKNTFGEFSLRTGVGFLQVINRGAVYQDVTTTDAATSTRTYNRVHSTNQVGVEATLISALRLSRSVFVNAIVDTLIPFNDPKHPNLDVEGSVTFKITQYVSINYLVRLQQIPKVYENTILQQDVFLRLNLEIM